MKFFGFLDIFSKIYDQNIPFWNQKNLQCNFLDRKWPPFGSFPKKHPVWEIRSPLKRHMKMEETEYGCGFVTKIIIRCDSHATAWPETDTCTINAMMIIWTLYNNHLPEMSYHNGGMPCCRAAWRCAFSCAVAAGIVTCISYHTWDKKTTRSSKMNVAPWLR